jgi:uncharacterized membrane protein YedE/YeeE
MTTKDNFWNPYFAGIMLGIVLFLSFFFIGGGLGASGAMQSFAGAVTSTFAPGYAEGHSFWGRYTADSYSIWESLLVYEVLGVIVGGFLSGMLAGRLKLETVHGPRFTPKKRWVFALAGGLIMGYGARLARGCTSGQALSGGATLAAGSWAFMMMIFIAAYAFAYFVRKQWT